MEKEHINQLIQNQQLLNKVGELAKIGGWEYILETNELFYTDEIFNILESESKFTPSIEIATSFYTKKSKPIFENAIKELVEEGKSYDLNLRIITNKGNKKWINLKGKAIYENNKLTKAIGTFQDIDNQIKENKILDTIIKNSSNLIDADINTFDYSVLTQTMQQITGAGYAILNIFDDDKRQFTTYSISGNIEHISQIQTMLNTTLFKKKWDYDERREELTKSNSITHFESLRDLTGNILDINTIISIENEYNLGAAYLLKIIRNSIVIGDFTLLFNKNKTLENERLSTFFANQAGLVIEKLKTEESLLHNELKQKQMISGISDVIAIIREDESIEYASPNFQRLYGWSPAEITANKFKHFIHPNNHKKIEKAFINTIKNKGNDDPVEFDFLCKNGQYKPVELTATNYLNDPIIKGILINFRDISKRRRIEQEAIKLKQAVEHSSAAIIITNPDANIEYVNPKFVDRTGYSFDEVKGKNPRIIQSGQTPLDVYENLWQTIKSGKEWRGELLNKSKSGKLFWEMTSISSIKNENGEIAHFVAVKENITGFKAQQEAIKEKNRMLEQINAEKDRFFSIIAHDLRSPFNSLLGLTQVMTEQLKSMTLEQIQQLAQSLNDSASNLYDLISNLLEWSTLQRGIATFEPKNTTVSEMVSSCCDTLIDVAKQKGISIEFDYDKSIHFLADRNMLKTILRNLVSNAIKFSYKGSKVLLKVERLGNKIQFSITDQGIGIPKDILENLFKIDKKTSRPGTENEPSTGLGLLLCRDLVEKHDGKIWAKSIEGKGTTFYFTLPEN